MYFLVSVTAGHCLCCLPYTKRQEADDLLSRTIYPEVPPRVEYKLTKRGKTLIPLLNQLVDWSLDNMDAIIRHREKYEL